MGDTLNLVREEKEEEDDADVAGGDEDDVVVHGVDDDVDDDAPEYSHHFKISLRSRAFSRSKSAFF